MRSNSDHLYSAKGADSFCDDEITEYAESWRYVVNELGTVDPLSLDRFREKVKELMKQRDNRQSAAREIIKMFRAYCALRIAAGRSVHKVQLDYKALEMGLFRQAQYDSWRFMPLNALHSTEIDDVLKMARQLISSVPNQND